jgi:hypothetical protein|tara:strand:- start:34 stop:489 length:456 start_codon:yes stop_codon:yes gene_type:complete
MKSLFDPDVISDVRRRLAALGPDSERKWGRMTPHQAVCHLADALRMVLGDRPVDFKANLVMRTVVRFLVLTVPVAWPKGVATAPELDQEKDGTTPEAFETDRAALTALVDQFIETDGCDLAPHPIFGAIGRGEWGRWGFRHLDHHLTQFGV